MQRANTLGILGWILLMTGTSVPAAEQSAEPGQHSFDVAPLLLDSRDGEGATIGLNLKLSGDFLPKRKISSSSEGGGPFENPSKVITQYNIHYQAKGVIAADAERNPLNYLDAKIDGSVLRSTASRTFIGGAFVRYEMDQSMDNRQSEFGVQGTYTAVDFLLKNSQIAFDIRFGEVDPKGIEARQMALGSTSLGNFNRWDAEFLYIVPLSSAGTFRDLEFNYRYYLEDDPPRAIEDANLDSQHLATIRLGLKDGLFIAYSAGKLPFDRESDRIYAIGFSYKLY